MRLTDRRELPSTNAEMIASFFPWRVTHIFRLLNPRLTRGSGKPIIRVDDSQSRLAGIVVSEPPGVQAPSGSRYFRRSVAAAGWIDEPEPLSVVLAGLLFL